MDEVKKIRIKRNKDSLQLFRGEIYLGSLSLKELCQILTAKQKLGTEKSLAQNSQTS